MDRIPLRDQSYLHSVERKKVIVNGRVGVLVLRHHKLQIANCFILVINVYSSIHSSIPPFIHSFLHSFLHSYFAIFCLVLLIVSY